ncbi:MULTISPECIES: replication-relaxation family protein [unclassified Streptomyces]|uniref:Replication-relaxation family protein n=1 Tax=Streptomyces sp. NBC_00060 TaxID=2975636 RepID=A0AAU2H262_9ACTN
MPPVRRITSSRLALLADTLTDGEEAVLKALAAVHLATAGHVARIVFGARAPATARSLAHRNLHRLADHGLIRRYRDLSRQRWPGKPGYVYLLTQAGAKLISAAGPGSTHRRDWRPADAFLTHRLAITELYVRLVERARDGTSELLEFKAETDAWRSYRDPMTYRLEYCRPDALVRLRLNQQPRLNWFIEIDRGTESPKRIAEKCRVYRAYEVTEVEQNKHQVFPGVIFIVPDEARAAAIRRVIAKRPAEDRGLFTVTTDSDAIDALHHRLEDTTATAESS